MKLSGNLTLGIILPEKELLVFFNPRSKIVFIREPNFLQGQAKKSLPGHRSSERRIKKAASKHCQANAAIGKCRT
jgi:hypothetical protein